VFKRALAGPVLSGIARVFDAGASKHNDMMYDIYLLQLGFPPVAVIGKLVQK